MPNVWFISDTHFGHKNILTFKTNEGLPLRKFNCVEDMDEHIIACWNEVVRPQDKVYHLGDIAMGSRHLGSYMVRLNGKKRLVRGNHDMAPTLEYMRYFEEVYGVRAFGKEGIVCSHIPIHKDSMYRWKLNIHGHLHSNLVMVSPNHPDPKYKNVSVEQINYTPINMDQVLEIIKERGLDG